MLGTKSRYGQIQNLSGRKPDSDFVRTKLEYYWFQVKTLPKTSKENSKTARTDSEDEGLNDVDEVQTSLST